METDSYDFYFESTSEELLHICYILKINIIYVISRELLHILMKADSKLVHASSCQIKILFDAVRTSFKTFLPNLKPVQSAPNWFKLPQERFGPIRPVQE